MSCSFVRNLEPPLIPLRSGPVNAVGTVCQPVLCSTRLDPNWISPPVLSEVEGYTLPHETAALRPCGDARRLATAARAGDCGPDGRSDSVAEARGGAADLARRPPRRLHAARHELGRQRLRNRNLDRRRRIGENLRADEREEVEPVAGVVA